MYIVLLLLLCVWHDSEDTSAASSQSSNAEVEQEKEKVSSNLFIYFMLTELYSKPRYAQFSIKYIYIMDLHNDRYTIWQVIEEGIYFQET